MRLGPLDQHLHRAADEALGALLRPALHELDQALHPLALDRVRQLVVHLGRLGAPPRREDEGEGAVVADLVDDLERLLEVLVALAREADDDVGGQRAVGDVLADQRHPVHVALAVVGARIRFRTGLEPDCSGRWMCSQSDGRPRGPGSRPPACPSGCGLV